jgi:23S rRNA pseudouridine2605 synthase
LRRIFGEIDVPVVRLVRVAIGSLILGDLAKGAWRMLRADEIDFASSSGPVGTE